MKAEAFFHLTANISYPLMVFISIILLPAMIVRFYQGWFQVLVIDLPLFLASTCSISSFYLAAERALYPKTWKRTFLYLPFVMAVGIGLSVRNALAVIEAIFGVKSEFVRTPKYRVEAGAQGDGVWAKKKYHKSAGWMPFAEVAAGTLFRRGRGVRASKRELRHGSLPAAFRLGLPLHRPDVVSRRPTSSACASAWNPAKSGRLYWRAGILVCWLSAASRLAQAKQLPHSQKIQIGHRAEFPHSWK